MDFPDLAEACLLAAAADMVVMGADDQCLTIRLRGAAVEPGEDVPVSAGEGLEEAAILSAGVELQLAKLLDQVVGSGMPARSARLAALELIVRQMGYVALDLVRLNRLQRGLEGRVGLSGGRLLRGLAACPAGNGSRSRRRKRRVMGRLIEAGAGA